MSDGDATTSGPTSWRGEPAGFVSRAVAFVIDAVVISLATSGSLFVASSVVQVLETGSTDPNRPEDLLGAVTFSITLAAVAFGYFTAGFWLFGRTLGKLAMGLRVVRADGERPSLGRSIARTLGYLLSTFFMLGFLAIAVSRQRRAWHDRIARTWVVYDWAARPRLAAAEDIEPLPPRALP